MRIIPDFIATCSSYALLLMVLKWLMKCSRADLGAAAVYKTLLFLLAMSRFATSYFYDADTGVGLPYILI